MFVETDNLPHLWGMDTRQKEMREYKALPRGRYHLCTNGWQEGKMFNNVGQFRYGMCTMAIVAAQFDVDIISFELMPNHIHAIIEATGETCLAIFLFIRHRINMKLKEDGYPLLPEEYWFVLKPIPDDNALQQLLIYLARNAYEKNMAIPGGYPWGSSYLFFSRVSDFIQGTSVEQMKQSDVRRIVGSKCQLPGSWEIHPELGVLPRSFVKTDVVRRVLGTAKEYLTRLVKDYESAVHIAQELGEQIEWSSDELNDIVYGKARIMFPGKMVKDLASDEKGRLLVALEKEYHFSTQILARHLFMPEKLVRQFLNSKDFGYRNWK